MIISTTVGTSSLTSVVKIIEVDFRVPGNRYEFPHFDVFKFNDLLLNRLRGNMEYTCNGF